MNVTASPTRPPRPITFGLLRGLSIAAAAGVVLALTGAFGSVNVPLWIRLIYWVPVMLMGAAWGHLCSRLIERRIEIDEKPWLAVAALTVATTGPLTLMVWFVTGLVFEREVYPLATLPLMLGPVLTITAVMSAINVFVSKAQPVQTHAAPVGGAPARFPDRLPIRLRGAVIRAVQAEDHYLRIHTDRGSDLILMRLSDALEELEGLEGSQTHRSWWVARDAVRDVARGDGRATLTLDGGLTVPVSRRYARALREAGWY